MILFLSDGEDSDENGILAKMDNLMKLYGTKIKSWWSVGFGPGAG